MRLALILMVFGLWSFTDPNDVLKKIDKSLHATLSKDQEVSYIILLKDRLVFHQSLPFATKEEKAHFVYTSLVSKAERSQAQILSILKSNHLKHQSFYATNAIKVTSNVYWLKFFAARADVDQIIHDAPFKMLEYTEERNNTNVRFAPIEWGIKKIQADSLWRLGYKGQGVIVGGQDTGYDWQVSPIKNKYKGYVDSLNVDHNYHWHDAIKVNSPNFPDSLINPCGYSVKEPCDDNNHGTHTMGTMVGQDENNNIGVAPGAKWIACRNMDRGWGQPSTYIECFEWFLAPYNLDGASANPSAAPHVVNNSWYCSEQEGCNPSNFIIMEEVVKNLKASGVVVVVSAGNSGGAGCGSVTGPPAFFEASFSVGATDSLDNIAGFSSRGPVVIDSSFRLKPNACAPGVNVRSVVRNGRFANFSGTSMAGPHMAGLVALLISANPALAGQVDIIEDILEASSTSKISEIDCGDFVGNAFPNAVYGYGIANGIEALTLALKYNPSHTDGQNTSKNKLLAFPNPVYDLFTIQLNDINQIIQRVDIYNIQGLLVRSFKIDGFHFLTTLDLSHLNNGVYFASVVTSDSNISTKIIKI